MTMIVIMGGTGTGKTKLAIDIARALKANSSPSQFTQRECEIVNADVMQCYAGSPIVTNKATTEEQANVPHHLMGFAPPEKDMKMQDYRMAAHEVLEDMRRRSVLPLLVGGSDYYIKSLVCRHFDPSQEAVPSQLAPAVRLR